jgi:lysophospholipase L1-like esterase
LNIAYGNTYGWQRFHPTYNSPVDDTGLSLSYIEAESPNQSAWIEATGSEFRVYFLAQPEGGDAEFLLDGMPLGQRKMSTSVPRVEVASFQAPGPDAPHRFEIRTLEYGKVRILGVSVEKAAPGVVYSALGLVGARAEYLLKCREESFVVQISAEQPDLIIMGYGTNETTGSYLDENAYATALATIISRMHRAAPSALVILLTPPDRGDSRPGQAQRIERILQEVIAAQRDVAGRDGTVVMDLHAAMGGAGSAARWATMQPPLARPDMTHFTNEGYNLLGRYIVGGIMKLYDAGAVAAGSSPPGSGEGREHFGELLPPLYPGLNGAAILSASSRAGSSPEPFSSPSQMYYFLMADGQIVVTNDLSMIDSRQGKVISPEEARCLLRGKASPCDNAVRW